MIVKVLLAIIVLIILALLCYATFRETVYTAEEGYRAAEKQILQGKCPRKLLEESTEDGDYARGWRRACRKHIEKNNRL